MAIFGALAELPLPEVLTMLGRRTGKLKMWGLAKGRLEMHLSEAHLKAMVLNGQPLVEIFDVRETITELMNNEEGEFEFERLAPEQLMRLLDIPLERLLITTMGEADEVETYRSRFAHPNTRFRSVNAIDIWIYDDLYEFWQHSADLLSAGASAEDLAATLGMPLEQVQLKLYKLRSLGKVSPVRAFYSRRARQQPVAPSSQVFGKQSTAQQPVIPSAQQPIPPQQTGRPLPQQPHASSSTPPSVPGKQRTLVSRLLKALQIGNRS